jgi:hypothetical protein
MLGDACIFESEPSGSFIFKFGQSLLHAKYTKYMYNTFINLVGALTVLYREKEDTWFSQFTFMVEDLISHRWYPKPKQ